VKKQIGAAVVACGLLAVSVSATTVRGGAPDEKGNINELAPTGKGWGENHAKGQAKPGGGGAGNGIFYHGGPVMVNSAGTDVYYIWYGNWSGNPAVSLLTDFATYIGGTPYFNINTTYYNGSNVHVVNDVNYKGATTVSAYLGTSLSDTQIRQVVSDAITGGLPASDNAVYFVLTSADVTASSGFCTQYCGWHTHATIASKDIKYSFVGDSTRCASSCQAQAIGPNGSSGADGMASIIAHELEEAVTDPDLNAWYDRRGYENADKCAWTFGSTYTSNGADANMNIGGHDWLIQQNWVNASGGYCAKSF